jgi:hypothetical protein
MLLNKSIKNIWELKNSFIPSWVNPDFIFRELKVVNFPELEKASMLFN